VVIFRIDAHAGRGATADENVIARSVVCDCASILQDEAISFVDGEIASQTALAMTSRAIFRTGIFYHAFFDNARTFVRKWRRLRHTPRSKTVTLLIAQPASRVDKAGNSR
jgi:hypothetical protein